MHLRTLLFVILFNAVTIAAYSQLARTHYWHLKTYSDMSEKQQEALQRRYFTLEYPGMTMDVQQHYNMTPTYGTPVDTSFSLKKRSGFSFGISAGAFSNIKQFGDNHSIAIDYSLSYEIINWKFKGVYFPGEGNVDGDGTFTMVGIPITVMYKSGGEVDCDPEQKFLWSVGAGAEPGLTSANYMTVSVNNHFVVRPYALAEIGVKAGWAWKLRATYFIGNNLLVDKTGQNLPSIENNSTLYAKATGSGNVVIALVFLPWSGHWGRD